VPGVLFFGSKFTVSYRCLDDSWIILHVENACRISHLSGNPLSGTKPFQLVEGSQTFSFILHAKRETQQQRNARIYTVDWLGESRQSNVFTLFMH